MNTKSLLVLSIVLLVLGAQFFETGDSYKLLLKKKKLYKLYKLLVLGMALKSHKKDSKKVVPIPVPIPVPVKVQKQVVHRPVKIYRPMPQPIYIHDSWGQYHNNDNIWK